MATITRNGSAFLALLLPSWAQAAAVGAPSTPVLAGSALATSDVRKADLMVRAALGQKVERTPVWLFRQAGRHLPEYQAYKQTRGKNFVQLLDDPRDVAECTLQPLRRYDLDAAILFSDILVVPQALGIEVTMPGGKGIQVPNPLRTPEEARQLIARGTDVDVRVGLSHVLEAVSLIRDQLGGKVPLIGFSAAPWTLFYYMVGGSGRKNTESGERWLREHPELSEQLLQLLTGVVVEYMSAQIVAGAQLVQLFEAMGEHISPESMRAFAMPAMRKIVAELKARHPEIPVMAFSRDATYCNDELLEAGYDVVTLDCATDRAEARRSALARGRALQGNLDPKLLRRGAGGTEEALSAETEAMLRALGPDRLIANLGAGLEGTEDPALCAHFVDSVHSISERMLAL
jgi:uroporphyrinogen decarboxylase